MVFRGIGDQKIIVPDINPVNRPVGIDLRIPFVRCDLVVDKGDVVSPVPHSDDNISFYAFRAWRRIWDLAGGDPVGPVRHHVKTTFSAESGHEAIHQRTTLTALYPVVPRGACGIEIFYVRNFSRAFITDLMASLTPFQVVNPFGLGFHLRINAIAVRASTWKFMRAWKVDNRQPVIRWVDRGCFLWCCRDNGGQINCLVRIACDRCRINQSVTANP